MPTDCAAMRLSRMAMMARPARERVRLSTMMSVTITRMKPAVKTRDGLGAGRALRALDDGVACGVETEIVDRLGAGKH